jgi:hypothetical protein
MHVWSSVCCLFLHLLSPPGRFLGKACARHEILQQNWRRRGQNRFCLEMEGFGGGWGGGVGLRGEMVQTMYVYMNKCINNKKIDFKYLSFFIIFAFLYFGGTLISFLFL